MVRRTGFTLIEVVVALVVLEVGLLGVVGSLVLAAQLMTRAELVERGVAEVQHAYDSMSATGVSPGVGSRSRDGGTLSWIVDEDGWSVITFGTPADPALVRVDARFEPELRSR